MVYRVGARSSPVRMIQVKLQTLGFYRGPVDGHYGGGTESAVRMFQKANGLETDGIVGSMTWKRLFPSLVMEDLANPLLNEPLSGRVLALTGSFETSLPAPECFAALNGNFDGQGISFGALQWNVGQGTLQPLIDRMSRNHVEVLTAIFGEKTETLLKSLSGSNRSRHLQWTRTIQTLKGRLIEPWAGWFKTLGRTPEFQTIQRGAAASYYEKAQSLCREYELISERGVALMFDIAVQNGSIGAQTKVFIGIDLAALRNGNRSADIENDEHAALSVIARRRAEAASPRWREDVLNRKLTIANGAGIVHGVRYELESDYGISLNRQGVA